MNFIKLVKAVNRALDVEPEEHLAFIHGQKHQSIDKRKNKKSKGVIRQVMSFLAQLLKRTTFASLDTGTKSDLYIYIATKNQLASLLPTMDALAQKNITYQVVTVKSLSSKFQSYSLITVNLKLLIAILLVFFIRGPKLYKRLSQSSTPERLDKYFSKYCSAYVSLSYFIYVLNKKKQLNQSPRLVLTSNDHNLSNRCLKLAAQTAGIETMYMQHASVGPLFPPLSFDYALLDGLASKKVYDVCEASNVLLPYEKEKSTRIYLSGQKKQVRPSRRIDELVIGLAINTLDELDKVISFIHRLREKNAKVVVRTHPRQSESFNKALSLMMASNIGIEWSNPAEESLSEFFSNIKYLVATNTSIHLESALAGIPSFFSKLNSLDQEFDDSYGYLSQGLCLRLPEIEPVDFMLANLTYFSTNSFINAVREYSETFLTQWEAQEGELSALIIDGAINDHCIDSYFCKTASLARTDIYSLAHDS